MLRIRVKPGSEPSPFSRVGGDGAWIKFTSDWQEFPDELIGPNIRLCDGQQLEIETVTAQPEPEPVTEPEPVAESSPIEAPVQPETKSDRRGVGRSRKS